MMSIFLTTLSGFNANTSAVGKKCGSEFIREIDGKNPGYLPDVPLSSRMNSHLLVLCLFALSLTPITSFAMVCKTQGAGETVIRADLDSTVAIPASVPDGDVVWRSERLNIQVECAKDGMPSVQEEVVLHLNPDNRHIGQGIRAGLSLAGVDYLQSGGRIGTGHYLPVCHEGAGNIGACPKVLFNLSFAVFIQKFGATPHSGVASDLLDYRVFQLDSGQGLDAVPGHSLDYRINNLGGLRFVACDAELQVVPENVDFGSIGIQQVAVGKVIERRPFSLITRRSCDSPFSLGARFKPVSGRLAGTYLVPTGNDGVGIRIVSARDDLLLRYNEPFHLADLLNDTASASVDFNAELIWHKANPTAGPFEAQVMVDLFYK
jgi:type 1 fimbria pilin